MDEPNYFQSALLSFVTDAACGGAIRHLVDIGYTLDQIVERLDYPAPRAKVQRIMMDYLYENCVLLREEPSQELFAAKEVFVQEQDALGRRSMRKIVIDQNSQENTTNMSGDSRRGIKKGVELPGEALSEMLQREKFTHAQGFVWKEAVYDPKRDGKLTELLHQKCEKNGEIYSYITCPFGAWLNDQYSQDDNSGRYGQHESDASFSAAKDGLSFLNGRQRDYIQGIRWDQPALYHRLNQRMLEIIGKLYEAGAYGGACFFVTGREKLIIPQK